MRFALARRIDPDQPAASRTFSCWFELLYPVAMRHRSSRRRPDWNGQVPIAIAQRVTRRFSGSGFE